MKKRVVMILMAVLTFAWVAGSAHQGALAATAEELAAQILSVHKDDEPGGENSGDGDTEELPPDVPRTYLYTVNAVKPENNIGTGGGLELLVAPGDEQVLEVNVANTGNSPVTISAEAHTAFTNSNGVVQYSENGSVQADESLMIRFADLVTVIEPAVELKAGETKTMQFELKVPQERFEGVVMGGLVFTREPDESEMSTGTMGFVNVYSYVTTVKLIETETEIQPSFEMIGVEPNVNTAWGPQFVVKLRNPVPLHARRIELDIKVYDLEDDETPVLERSSSMIEFAPNTTMEYAISSRRNLADGAYKTIVLLTYDEQEYSFETEFTIKGGLMDGGAENEVEAGAAEADASADGTSEDVTDEAGDQKE